MSQITQEEALRQADALVSQALKETEARCGVLAQFINDAEGRGFTTSASRGAVGELHALHGRRSGLLRRHDLIQQALECPVGERPEKVSLSSPVSPPARRTQLQIQVQARRRA